MSWARYIAGWVTAEITGAEPERMLRALAERGITFWGATPPRDYKLTVQVPRSAARLIRPLAAANGCEGVISARHGLPAAFHKVRHRYMLLACIGMIAALLYVGSAFVWQIDIEGNGSVPEGPIRQALQACGVDIGAYWPGFSQDQIRNSVLLRVPKLRWMTVNMRGSHAQVIVRERWEHLPVVDRRSPMKIVAAKAGLVEHVQALHGTAETDENMAVLPGQTLIGAYVTGRDGVLGPGRAIGTVTARTWYELTAKCPMAEAVKTPGGEEHTRWALILGKNRINFYKGSSICPAGCDKIIVAYTPHIQGLFTLPVTLEKTVYTAYETKSEQTDRQEALQYQLMERLGSLIGPDGEVLSNAFSASEKDGVLTVTLRAECREQIGREAPLTDGDLAAIQAKIPKTEE